MGYPLTDAQSYGLFLESLFYGIYLVTCGFCLQTLFTTQNRLRRLRELNWPMVVVVFLLFGIATVDVVLQFYRNLHTFEIANGPADATEDFTDISDPINVVKSATVCVQTTIADIMLVYRCWAVYGRSWLVISLPLLLVLANTAVTGVVLYLEITLNAHALLNVKQVKPFGAAFWALTIVINVVTTGLIVVRLWRINHRTKDLLYRSESQRGSGRSPSTKLQRVMRIIVESGLLYTGTSLITFITYVTNSVAVYVTTDIEVQVIGIAFNLIIIRAAQTTQETHSITSGSRAAGQYPLQFRGSGSQSTVPGTQINVTVTQEDDRDDKISDKTMTF
ncbi:hypothetical protein MVEN_02406200 [Mycena venus]|uniref:Uncharacterized protein n=1 Tax=Mycena venus TaxID=2733690 RepID=A0A8H6X2D6_9AGAR|nr:hypothetical protein MVEN_02406200 [Mycena venus]